MAKKLTEEHYQFICSKVNESGITMSTLKDDLVDHLCCVVEYKMEKGKNFEDAFSEALYELAPNGLQEIQRETVFLLNSKKIILMKKLMYLVGFLGAVVLTGGVMFKLLGWAGADELFMIGYLTLFLIFVPLSAIDRFKVALAKAMSERLKIVLGVLSAIILGLAGLFKILHLPGADFLLVSGTCIFAAGFLPIFFFTMYKKSVS